MSLDGTGLAALLVQPVMTKCEKMKRFASSVVLLVCSFAVGVCVAPVFMIEKEKEPVSTPIKKPIHHYRDRYGETIKRIV